VFEPIVVQALPDTGSAAKKGKYRILDGVHRWCAYKKTGVTQIDVIIKTLNNIEPILYAAKMAIGPKQLTEAETRNTARRAFQVNSRLTASEIGRAIGRTRQAVAAYIADLRAKALFELDLKIFKLNQLGIPQDRIAKRVGLGCVLIPVLPWEGDAGAWIWMTGLIQGRRLSPGSGIWKRSGKTCHFLTPKKSQF
jgi:hypothetical protein